MRPSTMTMTQPSIFSERPGFTLIGGRPTTVGPVVVRLDGSRDCFIAMKAAVGHAMTRTCGMIILDETGTTGFPFESGVVDERERSVVEGILGNSHVSRLPVEPPGLAEAIRRGLEAGASLLVLTLDDMADLLQKPSLMADLLATSFDVLILAPGNVREPG